MEERVPHPLSDPSHGPIHDDHDQDHDSALPSGTYVVQVPKDLIYRVPPPENALIVERYRNPDKSKRSSCCNRAFCIVLAVILILVVAVVMVVGLSNVFLKAKDPVFHVDHFLAKNSSGRYGFDVKLMAQNPNGYSDILYKQGGESSLLFKQKKIATGKFPAFYQDKGDTTSVQVALQAMSNPLPADIKASMASKKPGPHLSFSLQMKFTARMKAGFFQKQDVDLSVSCNYTIDTLAGGSHVLSEECFVEH